MGMGEIDGFVLEMISCSLIEERYCDRDIPHHCLHM